MKNKNFGGWGTRLFVASVIALPAVVFSNAIAYGVTIADSFTRVGASESLIAPFTAISTSTINSYSNSVEVIVDGTGASNASALNDAFYGVPSGVPYSASFYQLNVGWSGANLTAGIGEPRNIDNFITFIESVGAVSSGTKPAYNAIDNSYRFVIDVPASAGQLSFGVSDGVFADNSGNYNIQVFQLQAGAATSVPEPFTTIGTIIGGMTAIRMRKKLKS